MNTELQRVAIAKACGWKVDGSPTHGFPVINGRCVDPCEDLNAMHEAEKWMNEDYERGYNYDMELCHVVRAYEGAGVPCNHMRLYHATAAQRAEAFLRTIGKWQD